VLFETALLWFESQAGHWTAALRRAAPTADRRATLIPGPPPCETPTHAACYSLVTALILHPPPIHTYHFGSTSRHSGHVSVLRFFSASRRRSAMQATWIMWRLVHPTSPHAMPPSSAVDEMHMGHSGSSSGGWMSAASGGGGGGGGGGGAASSSSCSSSCSSDPEVIYWRYNYRIAPHRRMRQVLRRPPL
jgi:hypothetical protein